MAQQSRKIKANVLKGSTLSETNCFNNTIKPNPAPEIDKNGPWVAEAEKIADHIYEAFSQSEVNIFLTRLHDKIRSIRLRRVESIDESVERLTSEKHEIIALQSELNKSK